MILLPTEVLALYPSGDADDHGWTEPGAEPSWTGRGSLQLGPGATGVTADASGGHGPFNPSGGELGEVYLPPETEARDGMVLLARGSRFALSRTRHVLDPTRSGDLDVIVATVSEISGWPG